MRVKAKELESMVLSRKIEFGFYLIEKWFCIRMTRELTLRTVVLIRWTGS